jgi:predicted phage-related endonuclease
MNAPGTALETAQVGDLDRSTYIGGSAIAAIIGISPWATPLDQYQKMVEGEEPISEAKAKFFRNRKDQEPIIARRLEREYGVKVIRLSLDENPNRYRDAEFDFMAAEIDFEFEMSDAVREHFPNRPDFAAIPNGTLCNGEIKTVHPFSAGKWGEDGTEELPIEYAAQCMWGLGITHRPACLVGALFGIDALLCFPVMADPDTIAGMREKAKEFWFEHVQKKIPPAPINVDDVVKLYAGFKGKPVQLSDDAYEALRNLDTIRKTISAHENDKAEMEWRIARCVAMQWGVELVATKKDNKPVLSADENAVLLYGGVQAGSWNRQSRSEIDVKRLRSEQPKIAADYATESQFRVLRLKKGQA